MSDDVDDTRPVSTWERFDALPSREVERLVAADYLADARRVWRWRGANSLHELSLRGAAKEYTRISEPVEQILLLDAIEVIPCTAEAEKNLRQSRW